MDNGFWEVFLLEIAPYFGISLGLLIAAGIIWASYRWRERHWR